MAEKQPSKRFKSSKSGGRFLSEWVEIFNGNIIASKMGIKYAHCIICNRDVKVFASGIYDLKEHFKSQLHIKNDNKRHSQRPLSFFTQKKPKVVPDNVVKSDVLFSNFIAQHNLPMAVADHFTELVPTLFPDSDLAKKFSCKRTKATQIIKRSLAPEATKTVIEHCKTSPFSVMIDESNDKKSDKRLAVLVRIFDVNNGARSRIIDMPVCNIGTAAYVFKTLDEVFQKYEIPWKNCIGFASDNCSVMIGRRNSVLTRIREMQPNVFNIGCICHLANLCVAAGVKQLSIPVDELLIDIYFHFEHSSKRREEFKEFQEFANVDQLDILKHCQTRWLSLQKVVDRILDQFPALYSYFTSHSDVEKPGRVKRVQEQLANPLCKLSLHFLAFILPVLNDFNKLFQADETKIGFMMAEMDRLLRKLMVKFVKLANIRGQSDLRQVQYSNASLQHDDDSLAVGMPARTYLSELEDEDPAIISKFFSEVRAFYTSVVDKMLKKFPFEDQVLANLVVLDPNQRANISYSKIVSLAQKFTPHVDMEDLKDEFEDFQLAEDSHLPLKDSEGNRKNIDMQWVDILKTKTAMGNLRFPVLRTVMAALLSLPHSNADCERVFSQVRKIHTDSRKNMNADTLTALLQAKINTDTCCVFEPSSEVIKLARSATSSYNQEHS